MFYVKKYKSPVGELTIASDGLNITGLWMKGQKHFAVTLPAEHEEGKDLPVFAAAEKWLDDYFSGRKPSPSELPLAPAGSEFRQTVWKILTEIPYGETMTYGGIAEITAKRLGRKTMSAQAVGGAIAHNPIGIIIPCHRVIGTDGSMTGYAGGIDKKIALLQLEGAEK
ncbi:MAG: methylated-DNA--[protein]-cysteine S-methyltransferase [Eubacteriaceae bacterium]|jgi:methylated-DNA-[protein]-cysteine S-methyltransferase|nr:methylated-DNA--[protein]-cysteine S-methyltransferase [Eubacteriaceae bacterium]